MIGIVEALMCASDREAGGLYGVFCGFDYPDRLPYHASAMIARQSAELKLGPRYEETCLEAAYRIIERCPKLRKEWFGR